jgi:hypothetical protein
MNLFVTALNVGPGCLRESQSSLLGLRHLAYPVKEVMVEEDSLRPVERCKNRLEPVMHLPGMKILVFLFQNLQQMEFQI